MRTSAAVCGAAAAIAVLSAAAAWYEPAYPVTNRPQLTPSNLLTAAVWRVSDTNLTRYFFGSPGATSILPAQTFFHDPWRVAYGLNSNRWNTNTARLQSRDVWHWDSVQAMLERVVSVNAGGNGLEQGVYGTFGNVPMPQANFGALVAAKCWISNYCSRFLYLPAASTNGTFDDWMAGTNVENQTRLPTWSVTQLCAAVGAPSNYLDGTWTVTFGRVVTQTVTLRFAPGQTNGTVTNAMPDPWGTRYTAEGSLFYQLGIAAMPASNRIVTGTNGQVVTTIWTNEAIPAGFTAADYHWRFIRPMLTNLTATLVTLEPFDQMFDETGSGARSWATTHITNDADVGFGQIVTASASCVDSEASWAFQPGFHLDQWPYAMKRVAGSEYHAFYYVSNVPCEVFQVCLAEGIYQTNLPECTGTFTIACLPSWRSGGILTNDEGCVYQATCIGSPNYPECTVTREMWEERVTYFADTNCLGTDMGTVTNIVYSDCDRAFTNIDYCTNVPSIMAERQSTIIRADLDSMYLGVWNNTGTFFSITVPSTNSTNVFDTITNGLPMAWAWDAWARTGRISRADIYLHAYALPGQTYDPETGLPADTNRALARWESVTNVNLNSNLLFTVAQGRPPTNAAAHFTFNDVPYPGDCSPGYRGWNVHAYGCVAVYWNFDWR